MLLVHPARPLRRIPGLDVHCICFPTLNQNAEYWLAGRCQGSVLSFKASPSVGFFFYVSFWHSSTLFADLALSFRFTPFVPVHSGGVGTTNSLAFFWVFFFFSRSAGIVVWTDFAIGSCSIGCPLLATSPFPRRIHVFWQWHRRHSSRPSSSLRVGHERIVSGDVLVAVSCCVLGVVPPRPTGPAVP